MFGKLSSRAVECLLLESVTKNKLWTFLLIPVKECHFYGACLWVGGVEWETGQWGRGREDWEC